MIRMIDASEEHLIYNLLPTRVAVRAVPNLWYVYKRIMDIVIALVALALASPIILTAAIAIMIVSPGSPFFSQPRVGKDGRIFRMVKLRTMFTGAHLLHEEMRSLSEVDGPVLKIKRDPRMIPIGSFLRRYSIDELPNFWSVLRGDMAVVGPRPPLPSEVANYDVSAFRRLTVKPGITCFWQISGRSELTFDEWMELDNRYIDTWSPLLDLKIIAATPFVVFRGTGAY